MNEFITWESLTTYSSLITIVFTVVEFTKNIPLIKKIPTKYYSAIISMVLIVTTHLYNGTFNYWNIVLYTLSSLTISLSANGLNNFNKDKK